MSTTRNLDTYQVSLAISGINEKDDPLAKQEFEYEIKMRPHILTYGLFWDDSRKKLVIQVTIESLNKEIAVKQMQEEMFEISVAVLRNTDELSIQSGE